MDSHLRLIELRHAAVIYPAEAGAHRRVWSDVSITVKRGEWVVVAGANGSGKSTLASVLLGLCPLSAGELHRQEGMKLSGLLQTADAQFLGETIGEEFAWQLGADIQDAARMRSAVDEALSRVGLLLSPDHPVQRLSGGQKQLIHLAAVLASSPDLLVLDEPTAMLDPATRAIAIDAVRTANRNGTAVVWITHRLEEAANAHRVVAFSDGAVAFDGDPRVFFYGEETGDAGNHEESCAMITPCRSLGLEPPFIVKTVEQLAAKKCRFSPSPLTWEDLAEAVILRCR
ncbi:energy-coupling factor ABC transporter ATP-binding protein [Gorillibacterium massiliense]|uniref:energy-coupling factor ABC transporter ATP-binding protein n=1 Tax=Gorillibacterium massiliense TaxID=1280390 RepID=UPI0004BA64B9|nr:ATP-binding cassette domain-containing protein [Gorillibacterium massiliense]